MKTRNRAPLIVLFTAILLTTSAWAGQGNGNGGGPGNLDGRNGPPTAEDKLARMSDALELTPDQSVAMLEVLQAADERQTALREEIHALIAPQACANREATEADVLAILTPDQVVLFEEMKAAKADRANGRKGRRGPDFDCSAYESSN